MFSNLTFVPALPALVLERAQRFYEETLGLVLVHQEEGLLLLRAGGSHIYLYKSDVPPGTGTMVSLMVDDFDDVTQELRRRGISFEAFELPDLDSLGGEPRQEVHRSAWFKDSEGNVLKVEERIRRDIA